MKQYVLQIIKSNNNNASISKKFAFNEVPLLRFNSAKSDMNLHGKSLCIDDYKIKPTLGRGNYYKCLKISISVYKNKKLKKVTLRFVNTMIYASGYTLDQFTQDYTDKKEIKHEANFFYYDSINIDNYKEYLNSKEPFEKKFYSSLTKTDIIDSDYIIYLQDLKCFTLRSDYFLHYNELDTIIMVDPVNFLIKNFIKFNADMLKQVSNANCAV
jgi:hypothetical protein